MYPCINVTFFQPSQENLDFGCYGLHGYAGWDKSPRPGIRNNILYEIDGFSKTKSHLVKSIFSCRNLPHYAETWKSRLTMLR